MSSVCIDSILEVIKPELEEVEKTLHARVYSPVEMVTQVASHIVHSGGKRLRPVLSLLSAKLFKDQIDRAVLMSCIVEFIHTATLLHDDVIDHASLRRGRASANSIWGNKSSVLVGDYLYCKASAMIAEDGDPKVLGIVSEATANTTEGEVLEIVKSNNPEMTEQSYLEIIEYKTARLMAASAQLGALSSAANASDQEKIRNYGLNLGLAFQLVDDALDYVSSNDAIGKVVGTDLKEGKLTLPLIHSLHLANEKERSSLLGALENTSSGEENLKETLQIISKYEGIEYTQNKAKNYIEKAKEQLISLPQNKSKDSLLALAQYVLERKK